MGSTVSYTDLRENLEKGVCQTQHPRHSTPACQNKPRPQVQRELCSWTAWDHQPNTARKEKASCKPRCAKLAWETSLS